MEHALCIEDNTIYHISEFTRLNAHDLDHRRRILLCPECGGPAFFRNVSFNGNRTPCFGARPHTDGCKLGTFDRSMSSGNEQQNFPWISNGKIIVDFSYGSQVRSENINSIYAAKINDHYNNGFQHDIAVHHHRLGPLLTMLTSTPALQSSNQIIEIYGHAPIPANEFFVPLALGSPYHVGMLKGFWGLISDAKIVKNTLWLNSGGWGLISFGLDTIQLDEFTHRFRINDLEELSGALVLVVGKASIARNGKLCCIIDHIASMTLKLP